MPARMRLRGTAYAGASFALAAIVILKALAQRPNFYSAAVYLSQSSANLMILTNLVFVIACACLLTLQKLLYGPLRPVEVEQLYEKAWFAVTETCLAMTIFRGEVGPWFLIMFFALLAGKVWGWIGEGRVEVLEQQPPRNPRLFHTRLALSLGLSIFFDISMLEYVIKQVMRMPKPDMMVMFGFEFAVLSLLSLSTAARYAINLVEIGITREQKWRRGEELKRERVDTAKKDLELAERGGVREGENGDVAGETMSVEVAREALRRAELPVDDNEVEVEGWEGKGRWIFYLDLATDFFKLVLYLSFFIILLVFFGLPIHIMRDVFLTCRSFVKRISDFIKYRRATSDMNARYPDATAEEIGREDVCIICREEMRPYQPPAEGQPQAPNPVAERMRPKRLPCGHVLHFACLRSWLERQQVCPTCRRSVAPAQQPATPNAQGAQPGDGGQGQHPPGDRPIARVFQLGPLRIGVGAARGEHMIDELQREMADNRGNAGRRPDQYQQYQFGIRWDGRRRRRRTPTGSIREQLDGVERQIQEEMQSLAQSTREYGVLRNMQLELDRLRSQQTTTQPPTGPATTTGVQVPPPQPGPLPTFRSAQSFHPFPGQQALQAGSEDLPAGMTLPEGWSMMPLRPTTGGMNQPIPAAAPGLPTFPLQPQTVPTQFTHQVPHPEHVRAMPNPIYAQLGMTNPPQQQSSSNQPAAANTGNAQRVPLPADYHAPTILEDFALRRDEITASIVNNYHPPAHAPTPPPHGAAATQGPAAVPINGHQAPQPASQSTPNLARPDSSTQSLPLWGSQHSTLQDENEDASIQTDAEPSSSSEPSASQGRQPRVEDSREDPD